MKQPKKLTKAKEGSYNSEQYVVDLLDRREFPKIYTDMAMVLSVYDSGTGPALDLGSCTGIMAAMVVTKTARPKCYGVEGNEADYTRSIDTLKAGLEKEPDWKDKVDFHNFYVGPNTIERLRNMIATGGIELITARRVFPEICEAHGIDFMHRLAHVFHEVGIKDIILEGRIDSSNASALLHNADLEAEAFSEYYTVTRKWHRVIMLKAK